MSRATRAGRTSEPRALEDPAFGPVVDDAPEGGHRLAPGPPDAVAFGERVLFAGGRIDLLAMCEGAVYRSAEPRGVRFGLAQVRRLCVGAELRILHVLFAPVEPRPVLLGLAHLTSLVDRPLRIDYTELWDVPDGDWAPVVGGCERRTGEQVRVLADAGAVLRARAPGEPLSRGLALEVALALPPRATRRLAFVYAAPPPHEDAGRLVRAWRGSVAEELERVARTWMARLGSDAAAVSAFRASLQAHTGSGAAGP